jgi:hypothetical protein
MEEDDSITQYLLGVTRDAIERCVAHEDGDPAAYVYEVDAKGYAACFLAALRHWCHIHGLDWEVELSWGEEFFKDDLWHTNGKSRLPARPAIIDASRSLCGRGEEQRAPQTEQLVQHLVQTAASQADSNRSATCLKRRHPTTKDSASHEES